MKIEALSKADGAVLDQIKELEIKCREFDRIQGCLSLDNSLNVHPEMNYLFLLYESETLISVLTIFMIASEEAEIYACTLPEYRQRGCFSRLLEEARRELGQYGSPRLLFVMNSESEPGKKAMNRLGCKHEFTEYNMCYRPEQPELTPSERQIKLKRAEQNDVETIVKLCVDIFSDPYDDAKSLITNTLNSSDRIQYLALLGERPVGMGSVSVENSEACIHGLGISPEYQGKGYGRELLLSIISEIKKKGDYKITLEVNSGNDRAFRLYRNNGFVIEQAINYYREA